ncbi:MAG: ribosome maturation factor RimM [Chloroflexi bacterium]|nr:ribosome maturation factor RimM [Chloroflexota bacterium]
MPGSAAPPESEAAPGSGAAELIVAEIVAPHGIQGQVRALPYTDFPEDLDRLQEVILQRGPERRIVHLQSAALHGRVVLLRLEGVDDVDAASSLRGVLVKIPRSAAHPLPVGHFYVSDIIGMEVTTTDGRSLGTVKEVLRTGSNDVYYTARAGVPATREAVVEMDVPGRRLVVNPDLVVEN